MSGVEWLGQAFGCPPGWTVLPGNNCVRQVPGGWPEYQCAEGYYRKPDGTCAPLVAIPPPQTAPAPAPRRGSVVPALVVLGVAAGIFYAVVR